MDNTLYRQLVVGWVRVYETGVWDMRRTEPLHNIKAQLRPKETTLCPSISLELFMFLIPPSLTSILGDFGELPNLWKRRGFLQQLREGI
jgi:hypothetical protein